MLPLEVYVLVSAAVYFAWVGAVETSWRLLEGLERLILGRRRDRQRTLGARLIAAEVTAYNERAGQGERNRTNRALALVRARGGDVFSPGNLSGVRDARRGCC